MKITRQEFGQLVYGAVFFFRPPHLGAQRIANGLLDKLEAASVQVGARDADGFTNRKLKADEHEFELDDGEGALLADALEKALPNLPAGVARGLPDLVDRLRSESP